MTPPRRVSIQLTMLKKGAAEKGLTFDDDMQKEIDSTLETFSTYAKKAGYSTSAYLKLMYGNNMTMSTFKSILKDTVLASHYQQDYIDSLTYTDEEVETYYNEHKNNFDVADYEYIYFKGTADSTKDADGNTVKPTDEENAAAKEAASANANAALEAVRNGLLMEKAADNYDNGTYTDRPTGTYSGDAVTEWVFNEERQEGDLTLIESGDNYYVVLFHSRGRNDYNTVDVRHILFKVDTSDLDSKADDYQAEAGRPQGRAEGGRRGRSEEVGGRRRAPRTALPSWPTSSPPIPAPTPTAACIPRCIRARWSPSSMTGASTSPVSPATPASSTTRAATPATMSYTLWVPTPPIGRCRSATP